MFTPWYGFMLVYGTPQIRLSINASWISHGDSNDIPVTSYQYPLCLATRISQPQRKSPSSWQAVPTHLRQLPTAFNPRNDESVGAIIPKIAMLGNFCFIFGCIQFLKSIFQFFQFPASEILKSRINKRTYFWNHQALYCFLRNQGPACDSPPQIAPVSLGASERRKARNRRKITKVWARVHLRPSQTKFLFVEHIWVLVRFHWTPTCWAAEGRLGSHPEIPEWPQHLRVYTYIHVYIHIYIYTKVLQFRSLSPTWWKNHAFVSEAFLGREMGMGVKWTYLQRCSFIRMYAF